MRLRALLRPAVAAVALAAFGTTGSAYYHYLHYSSRSGPSISIPEKFDLGALFNKTVYFYVSDLGPTQLASGDSFASILSELRLAGRAWNDVETSDLRVAFGGLFSAGTPQATPRIEVTFEDLPPGLYAQAGVTLRADPTGGPSGPFVPILRSVLLLPRDQSSRASSSRGFFMTAVHELGHTLGLQHSLASSTMSTEVTRATNKARPIAADDVAGISLLYPTPRFAAQFGSITGQVSISGSPVHLASVVALTPAGDAVSALTNPDGTYRIDGVPPGQYYVYVHPLPPGVQQDLGPAEIVLPLDQDGRPIPASDPFLTQFFPGTQDPQGASTIMVSAGATTPGINFSVRRRGGLQLYNVSTWSFPGSEPVQPAYVNINNPARLFLVAWGPGLMPNRAPAPGLTISVLATPGSVTGVHPYLDPNYLQLDFLLHPFSAVGPRHLVFSAGGDIYVLPSGLNIVNRQPPQIASVSADTDANGNRVAVITGSNLNAETRILFDGLTATVNTVDDSGQRLVVTPPPGAPNQRAAVVALNSDNQTSQFLQSPAVYTYDGGDAPLVALSSYALPAGSEAMIEVVGVNTNFVDGRVRLGFGSSDVAVKRLWVMSSTRLRAEVAVAANAPAGSTMLSVVSGFQVISQPFAFQILSANPRAAVINSDLVNAATGRVGVYPGSTAVVAINNLPPAPPGTYTLTLNDTPVQILGTATNQITFQIPSTFSPGYAVLRLQTGGDPVAPVLVSIEPAPPAIAGVMAGNVAIDAAHAARPGDFLTLLVSGLGEPGSTVPASRLRLSVGGIDHPPLTSAQPAAAYPSLHQVAVILSPLVSAGAQVPLTISVDSRTSAPFLLTIRNQ